MLNKFQHLLSVFLAIALLVFSSCGSNNNEEDNTISTSDTSSAKVSDTSSSSSDFFYSLPSPLVMVKIFKKTGLKYVEGIANSPDNVSKYSSAHSKTLNLGVYSTDLAYAVLNKQTQHASKYMEVVKRLSDELGMSSLFNADDYLRRFKTNLNNEDSLIYIVSQLKSEMDIFLNDNKKENQALLIFIGSWIENMYIATQLTKEINKEKVAAHIAEQKYILNSLMNVGTNFQGDKEFKDIYLKLNDLKNLLDKLTVLGEEDKVTIDELQLKAITEKTYTLRKEIVG